MPQASHQLAAIMFTDIVGYTALMGADVESGLEQLRKNRHIHQLLTEKYYGKFLKEMGDGTLLQFNSTIDAIQCALEIQQRARDELKVKIRIGIHLGDVTIENEDVFGDGVNIASRIQSIADPGGIYLSESVYETIRSRKDIQCGLLGDVRLKNVDHPVKTYFLKREDLPMPSARKRRELLDIKGKSSRKVWYYIIAVIVVAGIALTRFWISGFKTEGIQSLAVLPVENLSGNEDEQWLMAGLQNGLIDELTKIKQLRIIPRRSTLKYETEAKSVPEIAKELDSQAIVEISLINVTGILNFQVRLIQALPEDKQLWAGTYNRPMEDLLTAYSEITRTIAEKINIPISHEEDLLLSNAKKVVPVAYEAYLKGMEYWEKLDEANLNTAMQYFELAKETDPDFAPAYFGISLCWGGKMQGGFLPYRIAGPKMKTAMDQTLALDSTITEAHYWNAVSNTWYFWNWEEAGTEFKKTLQLNPNHSLALAYYAHYLAIMGKPDQGLPFIEKAIELEKSNGLINDLYGMALRYVHRFDKAIDVLEKADVNFPGEMQIYSTLRSAYHDQRMYEQAIDAGIKYYKIKKDSACISALEQGYREGGYQLALQRNAEALIAESKTKYVTPFQVATLYTRAAMKEEALIWLEKAYEEHDSNMPYINADPIFDDIRQDPRFWEILRKMKFPELN